VAQWEKNSESEEPVASDDSGQGDDKKKDAGEDTAKDAAKDTAKESAKDTAKDPGSKDKSDPAAKTGDESHPELSIALMLASLIGLISIALLMRRSKE